MGLSKPKFTIGHSQGMTTCALDDLRAMMGMKEPRLKGRCVMADSKELTKELPDSGIREEMPTGSVRDSREGKGRFDLLPRWRCAA